METTRGPSFVVEPRGWKMAALWFSFALLFFGMYLYWSGRHDSGSVGTLVLATTWVLLGAAELLPPGRVYWATGIRALAVLVAVGNFVLGLLAPTLLT